MSRTAPRGASPSFDYLSTPTTTTTTRRTTTPTTNDQRSVPTWPKSQLWDRTYDEARFNDLSKKHKDDSDWLYAELHATRRRMHTAWSDNHQLSIRLGSCAEMQTTLDDSNHKIIDLKRIQQTALRESSDAKAQLARMRSRCEGLLITNERLEEFQAQAKITEQKWIGGLSECESYMKQLCEKLEDTTKGRDHYKQWAIDRTSQLREAEETLSKLLNELQVAVQQRDRYRDDSELKKHAIVEIQEKFSHVSELAKNDAERALNEFEKQQERLLATKMELSAAKTQLIANTNEIDILKNNILTMDGSLHEARDHLTKSEHELIEVRGNLQTTVSDLKISTALSIQLDTKLNKSMEDLTKSKQKNKEKKETIHELEKDNKEIKLKLEQSHWQVQVTKLEMERSEAVHREQTETYERDIQDYQQKIHTMERAIDIARAGAEAETIAKVTAHEVSMKAVGEGVMAQQFASVLSQQQQF